jgi:hypothetical protein
MAKKSPAKSKKAAAAAEPKAKRMAPAQPAKDFDEGTEMQGEDGTMWHVVAFKKDASNKRARAASKRAQSG